MSMDALLQRELEIREQLRQALHELSTVHDAIHKEALREDRAHLKDPLYSQNRTAAARFQQRHRNTQRQVGAAMSALQAVDMPVYTSPEIMIDERRKELEAREERRQRAKNKRGVKRVVSRVGRTQNNPDDVVHVRKIHAG